MPAGEPPSVPVGDLLRFVEEDAPSGDLTSAALAPLGRCRAEIRAKAAGVVAGVAEASALFAHYGISVVPALADGDACLPGSLVMVLEGEAEGILLVERTALNILSRMSGIATATRAMVLAVSKVRPTLRIAATRKTCPGMRELDKKAVVIGGGEAHRAGLSDMILIKDNHLKLVPLEEAVRRARARAPSGRIEVEVSSAGEAIRAAEAGAGIVMFDNMDPASIGEAIRELGSRGLRRRVLLEASGGIGPANLAEYASLDLDRVSVGALTHSVHGLDLSLEIVSRTA
ncbi:MAG TPA: carboxylating nicotinate-nucleotide diphosphorylase [Methanomicrobiales archaeon]|nr:carboxylating nicotinate-nucleotide diphosphorylase [Methanomicrobiales archaeon]